LPSYPQHTIDLLVIGAGLAGERTAIEAAANGLKVIIISLVPPRRSHSTAAQGGMQASLGNSYMGHNDSPDLHFEDTVIGSDWGCEQPVARLFTEEAPQAVREVAAWGMPWNRVEAGPWETADGRLIIENETSSGLIAARNFGGTQKWRTCYSADSTGHCLQYTLDNQVLKYGIEVRDRVEAVALIHDQVSCYGAIIRCLRSGNLESYRARATVIATGGCGRLYSDSTNAVINEGSGMALALETGTVPLANMEAVQFHPTGIVPSAILITEGARGDGGYLLDKNLHRFMPDYEPQKKELAFRDVVSRCMTMHMNQGFGIETEYGSHLWLDIRHLGTTHIKSKLPGITDICQTFNGLDPVADLIPVRPVQHYSMGGIRTDLEGAAYGLKGLFAVGESACWDLHGFNRLGGNSLAETLVAGKVTGRHIVNNLHDLQPEIPAELIRHTLRKEKQRLKTLRERSHGEGLYPILAEVKNTMTNKVGIFRNDSDLSAAVGKLQELLERSYHIKLQSHNHPNSPEVSLALRLPGMIKLALCITLGARQRTESRGSHYRTDYPIRDDQNWLKRTLATWPKGCNLPELNYEPVTITELHPKQRGSDGC